MHLLSTHPEIQRRLRSEIREHMPFLLNRDRGDHNDIDAALLAKVDPEEWKMWWLVLRPKEGVTVRVRAL